MKYSVDELRCLVATQHRKGLVENQCDDKFEFLGSFLLLFGLA